MTKTQLCISGSILALVVIASIYAWAYIQAFYLDEWWAYPTITILLFLGIFGGLLGSVSSFAIAFDPDKLK